MGDMAEVFNEWRKDKKAKKRANLESSTQILTDKGIEFEEKNFGVHLVVTGRNETIDFWPSTGKFICRKSKKSGRGVRNLLKLCVVNQKAEE